MTYPYSSGQVVTANDMNQGGLHLVTPSSVTGGTLDGATVTVGSAVSSVTVSGVFSADFDNYRIVMSGGTQSQSEDLKLKLGSSATGYYGFLIYGSSGGTTVNGANRDNTAQFDWVGGGIAGQASHVFVEVLSPFTSTYTRLRNAGYQNGGNYGTMQGEHRVASSYSSFTILASVGTLTGGKLRVYGYSNG